GPVEHVNQHASLPGSLTDSDAGGLVAAGVDGEDTAFEVRLLESPRDQRHLESAELRDEAIPDDGDPRPGLQQASRLGQRGLTSADHEAALPADVQKGGVVPHQAGTADVKGRD